MTVEREIGFWLLAGLIVLLLLFLFSGILLPFAAGLALGYLLDPIADRLQRMGLSRLGATLVIMAAFVFATVALIVLLAPLLTNQLAGLIENLPRYLNRLQALASEVGGGLWQRWGGAALSKLGMDQGSATGEMQKGLTDFLGQAGQWALGLFSSILQGGSALIGLVSLLVITPIVAFYMLLDWDRMVATIDSNLPVNHRESIRAIFRDIDRAMAGFLRGQAILCLALGTFYAIGLSLIGLNYGLLIGLTAGLISFIPYVGSLTALVVSLAVALVQGWPSLYLPVAAVAVVGVGQFLEGNFLTPKLVGDSVGVHPVWLMFALLAFGSLFGFTGLLLAVPLAAAIGVLVRHSLARYRTSALYRGTA